MEYLPGGITLEIPRGCFPLGTDSMVLAHFARRHGPTVLDLGSGCGTLGLLLCASDPNCHITGVEIDEVAHAAALENIARNGLSGRMKSICADLRRIPELIAPGSVSFCISNPPYFSGGPASKLPAARQESCCTLEDLMRCAGWALKYGGDFCLVHRPERLGEIIALGAKYGMEAKRLGLLHHKAGGPAALILLQLRKGGKPGLRWEELTLHRADGAETELYHEIYHL